MADGTQRSIDQVQPSAAMPGTAIADPAVAVAGLSKSYGGIKALIGMDLAVERGTVHAVIGENGAGKSTLMKILAGAVKPDEGTIRIDGREASIASPQDARRAGIGIVYQELSLFPERSILANLFPDKQPTRRGLVDRSAMRAAAEPVLARMGLRADPDTLVGDLDLDERQLVEISRVVLENPRVLILDEPNSALNEHETERLFAVLRDLRASGMTMLYVSHRLEEVFQISDRVTVMRNGRLVWTRDRAGLTIADVVGAMVGGAQGELFPERRPHGAEAATPTSAPPTASTGTIAVEGLTVGEELRDVTFTARPGEIIGLAGLEGSGVATLLGVLFGTRHPTAGTVRYPDGGPLPGSPSSAARRGVALVPADRRHQGLMLDRSIVRNISVVNVGALPSRNPWLRPGEMMDAARRQIDRLRIKVGHPENPAGSLSGGNQQKVVIGKWLEVSPRVMLLDDPTRGVDVGAKREIYLLIRALADEGRIVLFRSTELPELVGLADRILVLYRGRLALELDGATTTDHEVLHAINTGQAMDPSPAIAADAHAHAQEEGTP
ncbi:MAG: sugar ABC transporter ATP-binding protein [Chloroflexota bacterium]